MSNSLEIASHTGLYRAHFVADGPARAASLISDSVHFLVDARVAKLYADRLQPVLAARSVMLIDAEEHAKSLERMPQYALQLAGHGFRRTHQLIAIGGGIIQDITCFLSATMMRGVDWLFFPTTLLAQADSCIGSKSSINVGEFKNLVGTFTPPREVFIDVGFLRTLDARDVRSGVGEILKVHAIDGLESFGNLASDYEKLFTAPEVMVAYIKRALDIKKPFIEKDEFDRKERQIFNYGHSFGHALESATEFAIPHGIAVTMGMDCANFVAWRVGKASRNTFERMHPTLATNFRGFEDLKIPDERFFAALSNDKKNVGNASVTVILPNNEGRVERTVLPFDDGFRKACLDYIESGRRE